MILRNISTTKSRLLVVVPLLLYVLSLAVFGVGNIVAEANEKYTFSDDQSVIYGTGGFYNGSAVFNQVPDKMFGDKVLESYDGKKYATLAEITASEYPGGKCRANLEILLSSAGSESGILSPVPLPDGARSGNLVIGVDYYADCAIEEIPSREINIQSDASTGNLPEPAESIQSTSINVFVHSPVRIDSLSGPLRVSKQFGNITTSSPMIVDNSHPGIGSKTWSSQSPGSYNICITPESAFDFPQCQSVTKIKGEALYINFGDTEEAYNEDGLLVRVSVSLDIPGSYVGPKTFGPATVNLYEDINSGGNIILSGTTNTNTIGIEGHSIPAQNISLGRIDLDPVDPGDYIACINNIPSVCSDVFTKEPNKMARVSISISEEHAGLLLFETDSSTSCAVDGGLGWIICPIVTGMANVADAAFGFLADNFLRINANLLNTNSGTYTAWSSVRNIANVVFVIVFLIIIFSQITSFGIDNYGIKKMLPRLIIAAVLVNISFFITQLAVDLSNIIGYSTKTGLSTIVPPPDNLGGTLGQGGGNIFANIGVAVVTGAAIGLGIWAGLSALVPVLIAAVVALLVVFLMLVLREMLIVLLVVISPLAFVMFLLPNTKVLFDKWRKMFTALLLVFPIVGLIYGASTLSANVLQTAYPPGDTMGQIVVAAIMTLPLFLVPIFLKKSLDGLPALGAAMNRFSSKASGGAGKAVMDKTALGTALGIRDQVRGRKRAIRQSKGLTSRMVRGETGRRLREHGERLENEEKAKDFKAATDHLEDQLASNPDAIANKDAFLRARMRDKSLSASDREAATHMAAKLGRDQLVMDALNATGNPELQQSARRAASANFSSLLGRAPDTVKGPGPAFGSVTGDQLSTMSDTAARRYVQHLASMPAGPDRTTAIEAFNSAVDDIRLDPSKQGTFNADSGRAILDELAINPGAAGIAAAMTGAASIGTDGKIR